MNLFFFFFNDTATTEIYTLSLHDALPISRARLHDRHGGTELPFRGPPGRPFLHHGARPDRGGLCGARASDRKSTCLNSSHSQISYAVLCLEKKKKNT